MFVTAPVEGVVAAHVVGDVGVDAEFGARAVTGFDELCESWCGARSITARGGDFVAADAGVGVSIGVDGDEGVGKIVGRDGCWEKVDKDALRFKQLLCFLCDLEIGFPFGGATSLSAGIVTEAFLLVGCICGKPMPNLDADAEWTVWTLPVGVGIDGDKGFYFVRFGFKARLNLRK